MTNVNGAILKGADLLNPDFVDKDYAQLLINEYLNRGGLKTPVQLESPVLGSYLSDNGGKLSHDQAIDEIKQRLKQLSNGVSFLDESLRIQQEYVNVAAQNTIAAGFNFAQLSQKNAQGIGTSYFLNCAPREEERGQGAGNQGESIFTGQLWNGAVVGGTGPKIFWAFRPQIEAGELELFNTNVQTKNTQFRSLLVFPTSKVLQDQTLQSHIDEWQKTDDLHVRRNFLSNVNFIDTTSALSVEHIPDYSTDPNNWIVAMQENNGNLKLTFSKANVLAANPELLHKPVAIQLGDRNPFVTLFRDDMFDAKEFSPAFYSGSSGAWGTEDLSEEKRKSLFFAELAIIGGKLSETFNIDEGEHQGELQRGLPVKIRVANDSAAEEYQESLKQKTPGLVYDAPW